MLIKEFSTGIAELAILSAVVAAPLLEELFFRGIIQSWLVRLADRWTDATAKPSLEGCVGAPAPAPWHSQAKDGSPHSWAADSGDCSAPPMPEMTCANIDLEKDTQSQSLTEIDDANPYAPPEAQDGKRSAAWAAIFATSLLFAVVHGPQWPAPLGLFVLALVIGTVFYRTGSLIAAILIHATFNGISTIMLIGGVLVAQIHESKKPPLPPVQPAAVHASPSMDFDWMH